MARGLRVSVVAEGVETVEQARTLERMGCTLAQGHLFSAAVWAGRVNHTWPACDRASDRRPG